MLPIKLQKELFIGDFPLSQNFGGNAEAYARFGLKGHNGLDYAVPTGTPLISCIDGVVTESAYDGSGYGNYLKIENSECGVIYAHMKRLSDYKDGMKVAVGANIGPSGNTGNSTGPHLHFGVFPKPRDRNNGYSGYIDPLDEANVTWVDDISEKPESEEISKLEKIIIGLRKSRDSWKKACSVFEKDNDKLKIAEGIYLEQREIKDISISDLNAELTRFNEGVIDFNLLGRRVQVLITQEVIVPKGGVNS